MPCESSPRSVRAWLDWRTPTRMELEERMLGYEMG